MPRIEATDRSISPLMMISVIGSVMIAISPLDRPRLNRLFPVRNCGEADGADDDDEDHDDREAGLPAQRRLDRSARIRSVQATHDGSSACAGALVRRSVMVWSSAMATSSRKPQIAWSQNEEMPSTYSAELIVVSSSAPMRRADDAAAAAEDRHAADHHRGYDLQFVAGAGGGVDRAVLRGPQHAGDAGDRAADGEGGEHPPADGQARRGGPRPGWSRSRTGRGRSGRCAGSTRRSRSPRRPRWRRRGCRRWCPWGCRGRRWAAWLASTSLPPTIRMSMPRMM